MSHKSVVRNGNHFINLEPPHDQFYTGVWFLIDGAWFDYLEGFKDYLISLRPYTKMTNAPVNDYGPPVELSNSDLVHWERFSVPYLSSAKKFHYSDEETTRRYKQYGRNVYFEPVTQYLHKKLYFVGWRCSGGILPAYIKNPVWDENLEELLTLTHHYDTEGDHVTIIA